MNVYIYVFKGDLLDPDDLALRYGHLGFSFGDVDLKGGHGNGVSKTKIWGFNPAPPPFAFSLKGNDIEMWRGRYPGVVTDDTATFRRALHVGRDVVNIPVEVDAAVYEEHAWKTEVDWNPTGYQYGLPTRGHDNCVTFPQKALGVDLGGGGGSILSIQGVLDVVGLSPR